MAFIFSPRITAARKMTSNSRPSTPRSPLPVIAEDGTNYIEPRDPPPIPPRALNRPMPRKLIFGAPPRHNYEASPPPYSGFDPVGVEGPKGEKLADIRKNVTENVKNNKFVAKRGGWKRLGIAATVLTCIIVGLVVGLVVGLYNPHSSNTDGSSSSSAGGAAGGAGGGASGTVSGPENPASNTTFPAGSYRFDTFLETVSANCTSNSATWMCYPYTTYAQSSSQSAATFDWIISPSSGYGYMISSTPNYFSIVFSNATLTLQNQGQSDEYYFFQTVMQKPTKPTSQLGSSNVASTCYFNETTFQGYLYTKMEATYGSSSGANTSDTSDPFAPWPYAVKVEQITAAGPNTPTCLSPDGQSLGNFSVSDDSQLCDCVYLNTGT